MLKEANNSTITVLRDNKKEDEKNTDNFTLYVLKKNVPTSITANIWKIYKETKTKSGSATNNCKKETVTLKCHKNVRTVVIYRITVCTNPHDVKKYPDVLLVQLNYSVHSN